MKQAATTVLPRSVLALPCLAFCHSAVNAQSTVQWSQRAISGPPGRSAAAIAYDSARQVTVLFGGTGSAGSLGDTWEYNGTTWTQRPVAGPSARPDAAMCFDSDRSVCMLFGGGQQFASLNDSWEWDGSAWTSRGLSAVYRYGHRLVYDPVRHEGLICGGYDNLGQLALHHCSWNGSSWSEGFTPATAFAFFGAAYDSVAQRTV